MSSSDYTTQLKLRQIDRRLTTQINNDHYHDDFIEFGYTKE